jgi:biopolymer transport protein ExbD
MLGGMRRPVVLVLLVPLAACGADPPTCEQVAAHATSLVRVLGSPGDYATDPRLVLGDVMRARCTADGWSGAARRCMAAATALEKLVACRDTMSPAQAEALAAAFADLERRMTVTAQRPVAPPPTPPAPPAADALVISIRVDGSLVVGEKVVTAPAQLDALLRAVHDRDPATPIVLQAERGTRHGDVVDLMERVKAAGLTHLAIGTAP